jgi:Uncharacterised nucleotidyltransferase
VTSAERVDEVALTLLLTQAAVEAVSSLRDAGYGVLLLKGPSISTWVYDSHEHRPFRDVDLLLDPAHFDAALTLLASLGYAEWVQPTLPGEASARAVVMRRGVVCLDIHRRLVGVEATDQVAWDVLSAEPCTESIGGTAVRVLPPAARAAHLALHAAQRGARDPKAVEDLRRGLTRLPVGLWSDAADVARQLLATSAFIAGLRLVPDGRSLVAELGLYQAGSTETLLRASAASDAVLFLERLSSERLWSRRIKFAWQCLFPASQLATNGEQAGGPAIWRWRAHRFLSVARRFLPAVLEWRRRRADILRQLP